jgi:hypothetical protein
MNRQRSGYRWSIADTRRNTTPAPSRTRPPAASAARSSPVKGSEPVELVSVAEAQREDDEPEDAPDPELPVLVQVDPFAAGDFVADTFFTCDWP